MKGEIDVAYQIVADDVAYDVPEDATWLTDYDSRVITATWLRHFFLNVLGDNATTQFGQPEFKTTTLASGHVHIICTTPVEWNGRIAFGVGEAWAPNLTTPLAKINPAKMAQRRSESDGVFAVLRIADRVYTDDQIPRSEGRAHKNGLAISDSQSEAATPKDSSLSAKTPQTPQSDPVPAKPTPAQSTPVATPSTTPSDPIATAPDSPEQGGGQPPPNPHDVVITIGGPRSMYRGKTFGQLLDSRNPSALGYITHVAKTFDPKNEQERFIRDIAVQLLPEVESRLPQLAASGQGGRA
jgi:hypothetical protein